MKSVLVIIFASLGLSTTAFSGDLADMVEPIDWARFGTLAESSPEFEMSSKIVANAARHSYLWANDFYKSSESGDRFLIGNGWKEHVVRPPSSAALGLAMALKTGVDPSAMGASEEEITRCITKLVKGVAGNHKSNGGNWGNHWQSTLWAAQMGRAAWLVWDELDDETQEWVARTVVHEADRHIRPNYTIKYWNGQGGNSRAEENSWDCMVVQLAVAMMPEHPHVRKWKEICSKLMISAYSLEADMHKTEPVLDGKTPQEWLDGYNVREDGLVINHNLIHNDYMVSFAHLQMSAAMVFSLAQQPLPETYDFNFDLIYRTLVTKKFDAPPYKAPGGTMYIPGKPEQYYPGGTDWSPLRFACYYGMDSLADVFGHDKELPHTAAHWRQLRAEKIYEMQSRHEDGRMYAPGEYDNYQGVEQMVFWMMTDAHLLQWLYDRQALSGKANWLE